MAGEDKRTRSQLAEDKKIMKLGIIMMISALIFMVGLVVLVEKNLLTLHPKNMRVETLKGYGARIEYSFRYQTLLTFWLLFNVFATIFARFKANALNPLEEKTEERVQGIKNVLTNSFEQVVISLFSQLIFVSFAEPITILKYIPLINVIQFIGRVAFFAGYPLKRGFGFHCSLLPNVVLNCFNLYKLGSFMEFY